MDREFASVESTELPTELTGRTPRRVRITGTGWLNLFAAVLFSSIGIAFLVVTVNEIKTRNVLRQTGRESEGQVIEMWVDGKGSIPHIRYTFSVDGTFYSGNSEVPPEIFRDLHRYDLLLVRYLAENPNVSHPAAWEDPERIGGAIAFIGFFVGFGLMFVRRFPLQRRIAVEGVVSRGTITERERTGPSKGQHYVYYTFRNAEDEIEIGGCPSDDYPKAGSPVWVLYIPTNPRRSEVYPFGIPLYRIER
jgi:hypothetical protein